MKRLIVAYLTGMLLVTSLALPAFAHNDGGVDAPWSNAMNQASFWDNYFGEGTTCTKFQPHNGSIPSTYEFAVSKGGQEVRIYNDPPSQITGPHKNNGQHRDISWVMKCNFIPPSTTTTSSPTTTTIIETTTTIPPEETTTSVTNPSTTSTTTPASPSTTSPPTTAPPSTVDSTPPEEGSTPSETTIPIVDRPTFTELPYTGARNKQLIALGAGLLAGGFLFLFVNYMIGKDDK